jgi:hypothetical protein
MWSISNSGSNRTYLRTTDANGAVAASSSVNDEVYLFRGGHWNGSTNAACGLINIERSRGATINSNTILQSGDFVGKIKFMANDGTGSVEAATIHCKVDGTPGFGDMPGALYFSTTPDGNQFVQEAGRITNGGAWYIGDGRGSFPGHRIYGTNNGTAPTAGCVGEVIETVLTNGYWEQNSPGAAGWYDVTSLSMTLTAGHWMITFFGVIQGQQSSSGAAIMVPYVGIRTGSTVLISSQAGFQAYPGGYFIITAPVNLETRVNISSSTTYKISMGYGDYTGTPCTPTAIRMRYDWGSQFLYSETTFIRGVRIS